jgi:hypothetical protein
MILRITSTVVLLAVCLAGSSSARAQVTFEADWLFLQKDNQQASPFISGPDAVSTSSLGSDYESGYRFALFGGGAAWEVEAVFSQVDGWSDSQTRTLANYLVLDDTANNAVVIPGPPANTFAYATALFDAATNPNAFGQDETLESEHLQPGATVVLQTDAMFRDFELNFGTNRETQWWRAGLGWRNVRFDDGALLLARGTFDARDVDDNATVGAPTNDPNDGLSHDALGAAGYTLIGGSANGYDSAAAPGIAPDTLTTAFGGQADNELNGLQGVLGARLFPGDWMTLEGVLKVGVYHNRVQAQAVETLIGSVNDDSIYRRTFTDRKSTAAFLGSLGVRGLFPLTDYINFVAGYEVNFLTGVALGTEQFQGVRTDLLGNQVFSANASDSTILHGGHAGMQVSW